MSNDLAGSGGAWGAGAGVVSGLGLGKTTAVIAGVLEEGVALRVGTDEDGLRVLSASYHVISSIQLLTSQFHQEEGGMTGKKTRGCSKTRTS